MKKKILLVLFLFAIHSLIAQSVKDSVKIDSIPQFKFKYKQLIIPVVFIGYGIWGLENHNIQLFNTELRAEVKEHIDDKFSIDDISQYSPAATALGLDAIGIKGKNTFKDKAIILSTSYVLMGLAVNVLKRTSHSERPDGTSNNSFPSGHTATAFMGAELLFQEYKHKSIWYGISGYLVATGTGAFRIYNNRHWLSDVVAGAGIGILSTKVAYWLFPTVNKLFTHKESNTKTSFVPFYDGKTMGFGLVSNF